MAFAFLVVKEGPDPGPSYPVTAPSVIGRGAGVDISLADPAVSREHAALRIDGRTVVVEDLGSSNGTCVNGEEIEQACRLEEGDLIELGDTVLELRIESGEFEEAATPTEIRSRQQ